jgi:glycosyltransferase involved in cell wall biosynthesis
MKICLLSNALSIHTKRWTNYLMVNGYDVHLISYRWDKINDAIFHCYSVAGNNCLFKTFYFLKTFKQIKDQIWEIKPDILHAHYLTSYGLLGNLSGYKPLIVSAWGSDLIVDSKKSFFHKYIIKRVLKEADLITVMANHLIPKVKELGGDICKTIKVTLGINIEEFNINGREKCCGKIVILSSRVFEKEQNIKHIINSLPYVFSRKDNIEVRFYGDGSLRGYCEDLVGRLGIESNTKFFGLVDHNQMPRSLKQADIYVSTSTSDGDHVSLMEAMACGVFPVVSDIPANREWVEDGRNGFLVPLNDGKFLSKKIIDAIENQQLREKSKKYNFELVKSRAEFGKDLKLLEQYYKKLSRKI